MAYKTKESCKQNIMSFDNANPDEQITPTSLAYYKKIRRPQSAIQIPGSFQGNNLGNNFLKHGKFESHITKLTTKKDKRSKKINRKSLKSVPKVKKYDINTILSNKSGGMNLKDLFLDHSFKYAILFKLKK